ncbi:MAG: hypothetical protein GF308_04660 [Candidatus Heimdallarchaeota archaeon]|nr:hypothetical protein [Candidatus Heimdallarchaeota archaeon]
MANSTDLLEKVLAVAEAGGATEVIAFLTKGPEYQIRFSNSQIDISKKWANHLLEVFLANGRKVTEVDIPDPTEDQIEEAVSRATKFVQKMPENELYGGIEEATHSYSSIDGLYDKRTVDFYERAPELVNVAIQASLAAGAKRSAGVLYFGTQTTELLTSHGASGSFASSYYRLTLRAFVDFESSGQDVVVGRDLSGLEDKFTTVGSAAGKIAKMAVSGKQGKAGKYDIIMSPIVAGNVFGQITDGANPIMMLIGMSPLGDHFGEQIGPENFHISDNPQISEGLGSRPFDVEGTPAQETPIINKGVLVGLIHNTSTAQIMQAESTGNSSFVNFGTGSKLLAPAPTNMVYEAGDYTLEEMIAESRKPTIYLTSNWYTRFTNMLEGEFSTIPRDGMFLIENGEIKKPVRKLRLTENLLGMSKRISALGKNVQQINWWEVPTPTFIPPIKVADCNITAATK